MIVCIAEKPSVARDIAEVLGAHTRKEGYIEGNGYQVTWTFGHLCTLKEPHEYTPNWKSWSLGSLPMIPPRFGIKLIGHDPGIEKQFHIIEQLMQNADEIINCGDAVCDQLLRSHGGVHVRAGDLHPHAAQHQTQRAHGNAADPHQMRPFSGLKILSYIFTAVCSRHEKPSCREIPVAVPNGTVYNPI